MEKQTVINTLKKNGYERFEDNHYVKGVTSVNLEENSVMGFGGVQEVFQSLGELLNYLGLKEHTEKQTVFIKRYPSKKEFPKTAGYYDTNVGRVFYVNEKFDRPKKYYPIWWLEAIELPSEEDIKYESRSKGDWYDIENFIKGANFILNKLKGE